MSLYNQAILDVHAKLTVDLFAGGGGASAAFEQATGRQIDIAINHDANALEMHKANHPQTRHILSDVFEVDPREVCGDRGVAFLWASPDCTFHSKARGGKPIRDKTRRRRALAWIVRRWAGTVRPDIIMLENVEEFADWGPLVGPPDALQPCKKRRGKTFRTWVKALADLGYTVGFQEIRASDYGAATIRKRLFMVARCDGHAVEWASPTHGNPKLKTFKKSGLLKWDVTGNHIDWTTPMCSIFATNEEAKEWAKFYGLSAPKRPLVEKTCMRIARGIGKFVLSNPTPYFVCVAHGDVSPNGSKRWGSSSHSIEEPLQTITGKGNQAVITPTVLSVANSKTSGRGPNTWPVEEPLRTVTSSGAFAIAAPSIVPRYGEAASQAPRCMSIDEPGPAIVPDANGHQIAFAQITTYYGDKPGAEVRGQSLEEPLATQPTENRHGIVAGLMAQANGGFAEGNSGDGRPLDEPISTICGRGTNQSVVAAFVDQPHNGFEKRIGRPMDEPLQTIVSSGATPPVVTVTLIEERGTASAQDAEEPLRTISGKGTHHGIAAAYVPRDFGASVGSDMGEPIGTITGSGNGKAALCAAFMTKDYDLAAGKHGFVSVEVESKRMIPTSWGTMMLLERGDYVLSDICMRMLQPRELYACQGFRAGYVIDRGADGRVFTKTQQVLMCGNSVSPPPAEALIRANCKHLIVREIPKPRKAKQRSVA